MGTWGVYRAPKASNAPATLVWDSSKPGDEERDLVMDPGEFEDLQWVFTKDGTYVLEVELQGYIRDAQNRPAGAAQGWKPISGNETVTAIARYTFQVGDTLEETEPPIFGVNLSVPENSPAGVKVGAPIPVYNAEADILYFELSGKGHEHFKTVASTDPHAVQIVVAYGASLDYETRPSYDLELTVTDRLDHEGNPNKPRIVVDDTLLVRIDLKDQEPGLEVRVDKGFPAVGETVNFIARFEPTPDQRGQTPAFQWEEEIWTQAGIRWHVISSARDATWSVSQSSVTRKTYRASVILAGVPPTTVNSSEVEIFWDNGN